MHTPNSHQTLPRPARGLARLLAVHVLALAAATPALAADPPPIPLSPDRWKGADVAFEAHRGVDALFVKKGMALLQGVTLADGTIEFDVDPAGPMGAGAGFRHKDDQSFEDFYLRPRPNCEAAPDCMQYAPVTRGVLLWDLFPQYQAPAPLKMDAWNHVKLVVAGRRLNVYVNGASTPTLAVGRLAGDTQDGGVFLQGPAYFTNVRVTPGATAGLNPRPEPDRSASDPRFVRNWSVSSYGAIADGTNPSLADLPPADKPWTPLSAEAGGLVNVSRLHGRPYPPPARAVTWLRTTITSDRDQTKKASIGWTREVWVFVNGKQVFADRNLYQPPSARKTPDGRCSLENGTLSLPLVRGRNEVAVALVNNFYGWALTMRLDDVEGIRQARR